MKLAPRSAVILRSALLVVAAFCPTRQTRLFAQAAPPATPPSSTTSAAKDAAVQLSVFTVSEEKELGYESMQTTAGMRTVQELKNVANSISIMNAQLIEDTASLTLDEMSTWFVSGESQPIIPTDTVSGKVILRGINNAFALRNGWIWYAPNDSFSTERVEQLRGPNAFLYGEADLGGAPNTVTKRGLFGREVTRGKLMVGNNNLYRGEIDLNRRLVQDKLAVRVSAVQSKNDSWIDNVRRDFRGVYGAMTYRPFRATTINVTVEHMKSTAVNPQGLYVDAFSRVAQSTVAIGGGFIYVPRTGAMYRAQGRVISTGPSVTIADPSILPKEFQANGPNATYKDYTDTVTFDLEHNIDRNLHLQLSGNYSNRLLDNWTASARTIIRDRSPFLANGQPNPYYNELYTEYFRIHSLNGNVVRDVRLSAVYDFTTKWMKQQFLLNLQQHQDNPGQRKPKYGEYLDPSNPNWTGVINPAVSTAAATANRTVFTNNRFFRRYYLKDGTGGSDDLGPIPGVSAWYPDLGNSVAATGHMIYRRFYIPSWGVGASGSYFHDHLFTMVGYRQDQFNMKTTLGMVRPQREWANEYLDAFNAKPFVHYKADGANYGGIFRLNDVFAIGYNYAQSFQLSRGEGAQSYNVGELQSLLKGEGSDISARLTLFKGRLEFSATHYNNFSPNARVNPAPVQAVRDEVAAIFPTTFVPTGQDYQTTTTKGYEFEAVANLTRNWALTFNVATNKVINVDRLPLLKGFQAEARALGKPTPLLDDFLLTYPEGVPNAGYTKARFNVFTRYTFTQSFLRGVYVGGGVNWRARTYRGTADLDGIAATPVVDLYGPSYYIVSLLAGYRTKVFNRASSIALNVGNLLDKEYYRTSAVGSGSWGDPRSFRLTMTTDF